MLKARLTISRNITHHIPKGYFQKFYFNFTFRVTLPEGGIVHLIKQTVQIKRKEMNQQREKSNLTEGEKKKKKKKRCGKKIRNCSSDMFVVHLTGIYLSFCRVKQIFEASVLDAGKH